MKIKKLFDDLKRLGKKKYYFKDGEEEIYFSRKDLEIEIVHINNNIDLIINHNGFRDNKKKIDFFEEYRKSPEFWGFFLCLVILQNCEFSI